MSDVMLDLPPNITQPQEFQVAVPEVETLSRKLSGIVTEDEPEAIWESVAPTYYNALRQVNSSLESAADGTSPPQWDSSSLESVTDLLSAWKFTFTRAEEVEHTHPRDRQLGSEYWDHVSARIHDHLGVLFNPRMGDITTRLLTSDWERVERTDIVEGLLNHPDFASKGQLTEYLGYRIWLAYLPITYNSHHESPDPVTGLIPSQMHAREVKDQLSTVAALGLSECIKTGEWDSAKKTLSYLLSSEGKDVADRVLADTSLTPEQREQYVVHYINTFGYIPFVETFAPIAKTSDANKQLFEAFSGQEVMEVMSQLDEVYNKALEDFITHYEEAITNREVGLISQILEQECGKSLSEAKVVDLAAGFGRVTKKLLESGCGQVTAVEPHDGLFAKLNELTQAHGNLHAIQGRWDQLMALGLGEQDLGVCIGRSLPHANNWDKLLTALSQMTGSVKRWLIDYPDPTEGVYADFAGKLEETLVSKGVTPEKAKMIYDSPNGKWFFHRMVVTGDQLREAGQLFGVKVREVRTEFLGDSNPVKNVYYLLEPDPAFDIKKLCGDPLMAITADLGLRRPGTNFNQVFPQWGMSLGQALIYSHESPDRKDRIIEGVIRNNQRSGVPQVSVEFDENGMLYLEVMRPGDSRSYQ